MSTTPPPSPTPEDRIRRLLADARHTEPVPDDVAERLDRVLADLGPESAPSPPPAVTDLAAARRRHRARTWLVAAAAVVAVGIGVDQIAQHDALPSGSGSGGGSTTSSDRMSAGSAASGAEAPRTPGARRSEVRAGKQLRGYDAAAAVPLSGDRFAARVARLRDRPGFDRDLDRNSLAAAPHGEVDLQAGRVGRCRTADLGRGHWLAVRYDGAPGLLVYRPVRGDTQVVDLFLCGHAAPTRSVTLPAP
jgi:hypothetical protein